METLVGDRRKEKQQLQQALVANSTAASPKAQHRKLGGSVAALLGTATEGKVHLIKWPARVQFIYFFCLTSPEPQLLHLDPRSFPHLGPRTHVLVGHLPVRPLPVRHHFPHDDAVAPGVAGRGELPVRDGLGGGPPDGDLATLQKKGVESAPSASNQRADG